jgi:hypothetical protein
MTEIAENWAPVIAILISLASIIIAFSAFVYSLRSGKGRKVVAPADSKIRENPIVQQERKTIEHSKPESKLGSPINPNSPKNQGRFFKRLCLAFLFTSSNRTRALILHDLRTFSADETRKVEIHAQLQELQSAVAKYENESESGSIANYTERLERLIKVLSSKAEGLTSSWSPTPDPS